MVKVQVGGYNYYMNERLRDNLDELKVKVTKKDEDCVLVVDGYESDGKSVFALQIGRYLDKNLSLDRVCFSAKEFSTAIDHAQKGSCIIFDEAFKGLSSRSSMSEVNNILVSKMMQMRQLNLFVIIVLPTIFMLDKYVALFRSKALFHVYRFKGQRGYWILFNRQKKKLLYLWGKKNFDYSKPKSNYGGRFTDFYCVDEQEYRKKKRDALQDAEVKATLSRREIKHMRQRDALFYFCHEDLRITLKRLAEVVSNSGFKIDKSEIGKILVRMREKEDFGGGKI